MIKSVILRSTAIVTKFRPRRSHFAVQVSKTYFSAIGSYSNIGKTYFSTIGSCSNIGPTLGSNKSLQELAHDIIKAPVSRLTETETEQLCKAYRNSSSESRNSFLLLLSSKYSSNVEASTQAAQSLLESKDRTLRSIEMLRRTSMPDYYKLFTSISKTEDGIRFLVGLRKDLLKMSESRDIASNEMDAEKVNTMDGYLKGLLSHWLGVGLLKLEQLTWNSSAAMLEKVSKYEAVHPVRSWNDLKIRVGPCRRVFIFTHRSLPNEPLVILHIAFTKDISERIGEIIPSMVVGDFVSNKSVGEEESNTKMISMERFSKEEDETREDLSQVGAAIFYSISSPQKGLQGIELGTVMIREVARKIAQEFPGIRKFSSLSPIPGFRDHLLSQIQSFMSGKHTSNVPPTHFINSNQLPDLQDCLIRHLNNSQGRGEGVLGSSGKGAEGKNDVWYLLYEVLRTNSWIDDEELSRKLYLPLMRKCAHYLYSEKKRGYALNPVAHFHMKNGSVMWRLNWKGDVSYRGLKNSCGLMVNYRYYIEDVETNSQRYIEDNYIPTSSLFTQFLSIEDQHEK